ncbi:hypothetical protein AAFF27_09695 [Xylophilus sp. GW821-FHT01B05]
MDQVLPVGQDGYLTYRIGGHLSSRIVFRYSTEMVKAGTNTLDNIRKEVKGAGGLVLEKIWDDAVILEDGKKKTIAHQGWR